MTEKYSAPIMGGARPLTSDRLGADHATRTFVAWPRGNVGETIDLLDALGLGDAAVLWSPGDSSWGLLFALHLDGEIDLVHGRTSAVWL